jgi:hypothetical protein
MGMSCVAAQDPSAALGRTHGGAKRSPAGYAKRTRRRHTGRCRCYRRVFVRFEGKPAQSILFGGVLETADLPTWHCPLRAKVCAHRIYLWSGKSSPNTGNIAAVRDVAWIVMTLRRLPRPASSEREQEGRYARYAPKKPKSYLLGRFLLLMHQAEFISHKCL